MFRLIVLLLFQRCSSSALHSVHYEDEVLGPVMRRESLKAELLHMKSREEADAVAVDSTTTVDIHQLADKTEEGAEAAFRAAREARPKALSKASWSTASTVGTVGVQKQASGSKPFSYQALTGTTAAPTTTPDAPIKGDSTSAKASDVSAESEAAGETSEVSSASSASGESSSASSASSESFTGTSDEPSQPAQYSRKYTTTSRRTMTVEVTTATTSIVTAHSTTEVVTATIPLKIPPHMHPVVAPGSHFPEELSAASWRSLQARATTTSTSPAMSVQDSMTAAATVAAAQRAGSQEDAAVQAAKAAAWILKHQLAKHVETSSTSTTSSWLTYVTDVPTAQTEYAAAAQSIKKKYADTQIPFASNRSTKVGKEVNLTGHPMKVRVVTRADGDIEAPEDDDDTTMEPRAPGIVELNKMNEMIDEVVLKDLPKIVAAVAAKISHRPFESEIPKAASRVVVKLLTETAVKDVPEAIIQMLMELASQEHPSVDDPVPIVADALEQILDDYRPPEREDISAVVDQAIDSAHEREEAPSPEPPQSEKVVQVITDAADRLAKGSEGKESEDDEETTTPEAAEESNTAEAAAAASDASDGDGSTETDEANATESNATAGDGEAINSAEVLPDEDQPHTAAEMIKSAKEHKGTAVPSNQRPIAVHSVKPSTVVKAVTPNNKAAGSGGDDDHDEEDDMEAESPAKSGGKVLVGLTVFLGSLLMVVAIASAGYMAYQRRQAPRPAETAPAAAEAAAPAAPAASRASGASHASGAALADAAPTFTGGPEAGA